MEKLTAIFTFFFFLLLGYAKDISGVERGKHPLDWESVWRERGNYLCNLIGNVSQVRVPSLFILFCFFPAFCRGTCVHSLNHKNARQTYSKYKMNSGRWWIGEVCMAVTETAQLKLVTQILNSLNCVKGSIIKEYSIFQTVFHTLALDSRHFINCFL